MPEKCMVEKFNPLHFYDVPPFSAAYRSADAPCAFPRRAVKDFGQIFLCFICIIQYASKKICTKL